MNIKDAERRQSVTITFRLSEKECRVLDDEAERKNVNRSDIIREAVLGLPFMRKALLTA